MTEIIECPSCKGNGYIYYGPDESATESFDGCSKCGGSGYKVYGKNTLKKGSGKIIRFYKIENGIKIILEEKPYWSNLLDKWFR